MQLDRLYNIADIRAAARRRLPKGIFEFIDRGAEDDEAVAHNLRALRQIKALPQVLVDITARNCEATMLGQRFSMPFAIAPTGAAGLVWLSPWIGAVIAPPVGARWRWLIPVGVREAVAAAIAAQVCVLPVLASTFGSVPLLGLIATTPGLLLVPPLMAGSAALSVASASSPLAPLFSIATMWPMTSRWLSSSVARLAIALPETSLTLIPRASE